MAPPISSSGEHILRLAIAMVALTGVAVFLRFLTRVHSRAAFAADDWWVLLSLCCFYVCMGTLIWSAANAGLGDPLTSVPIPLLEKSLKLLYVSTLFSITTTATAKFSILCLYRRVFSTESFRRNSLIVGGLVAAYWLTAVIGAILQCVPVKGAWDILARSHAKCMNFAAFFLGLELYNCILDVAIFGLALQVVWDLHMPLRQRIQLALIFLLGGFVLVAGIVRMAVLYKAGSTSLSLTGDDIWATIENACATLCACIIVYRPLLSKTQAFALSMYASLIGSTQSSRKSQSKPTSYSPDNDHSAPNSRNRYYNQIEDGLQDHVYLTKAVGGPGVEGASVAGKDYPLESINVKKTTEVV